MPIARPGNDEGDQLKRVPVEDGGHTDACGEVEIAVPRAPEGSLEPQIVRKRQRRLTDYCPGHPTMEGEQLATGRLPAELIGPRSVQASARCGLIRLT